MGGGYRNQTPRVCVRLRLQHRHNPRLNESCFHKFQSRLTKEQTQRSRTRNGERFRAWSDLGAITVQEIITETDASSLNKPGDWIQASSEFQRMDKGRS